MLLCRPLLRRVWQARLVERQLTTFLIDGLEATHRDVEETEARHVAIEGGKSPEEVDAIVGPQKVIRVSSPAARVRV